MAESTIRIVGQIIGSGAGPMSVNTSSIINEDAPMTQTEVALASGDNTITIPGTIGVARGVIIIPDPLSAVTKKLKGAGGDTGIIISKIFPTMLTFDDTPPASFILNSSAAETTRVTIFQFF